MQLTVAAKLLGGQVAGRSSILCPGPGHSPRDRSLSVTFGADGAFTVHSHAGDDWRACRDYVRDRLRLEDAPAGVIPVARADDRDTEDRVARARALWRDAVSIDGSPATAYLASRGLSYRGHALRWHPACPFGKDKHGAMLALVRDIHTNEPRAVHRTAIDGHGRKNPNIGSNGRMTLGPVSGCAVKLVDDHEVTNALGIGEGIETTLSLRLLPGLGLLPVWSLLSANGVASFPVLAGIESVWIATDNDASGTGEAAAAKARDRLCAAGLEAITLTPIATGADLNDAVAAHA